MESGRNREDVEGRERCDGREGSVDEEYLPGPGPTAVSDYNVRCIRSNDANTMWGSEQP